MRTHQACQYVDPSPERLLAAARDRDRQALIGEFVDHGDTFELQALGAVVSRNRAVDQSTTGTTSTGYVQLPNAWPKNSSPPIMNASVASFR